jgi:tetratricopeptide (TPR) repeat protein
MNISIRKFSLPLLLSFGLLLISSIPAVAQTRAVAGKVTDEKGQPVADAQISIQGMDQYRTVSAKTNKKGEYMCLLGSQSGTYRVVVRKAGYEPQFKENVQPQMGEQAQVDFQLTPGQDHKLPFEMTAAEKEQMRQQAAQAEKRKEFSAEVKAHFDSGVQMSEQGKYAEAVDEFNKALEKDPKQPGILSRMADAYAKQGKNEDALAAYQKAIDLNPTDPELLQGMGVVLNKLGKTAESQEAFKKAATLNPNASAPSLYNLGVSLFNNGNVDGAVDAFKQAIAADPNFAEAYFQLGVCLSAKPETIPAAVEAMKKYIQIGKKPDQVEVAKQMVQAMTKK